MTVLGLSDLDNQPLLGGWFPLVVGVWVLIYLLNAASWYLIIHNGGKRTPVGFGKVYKLTISGFALNYATPCGLMNEIYLQRCKHPCNKLKKERSIECCLMPRVEFGYLAVYVHKIIFLTVM